MNKAISAFVYKRLIKDYRNRKTKKWKKRWNKYVLPNRDKAVQIYLHGEEVEVNCGYTYPLFAREFRDLNNPLLQLAYSLRTKLKRGINFIDIGAAIGDTVLLLQSNIDDAFEHAICIDGDHEFFSYLNKNMRHNTKVTCVNTLLSDSDLVKEKELVRTHTGTASAQGEVAIEAKKLDTIINELALLHTIDLLKIDVDGFDGKVLAGASKLLSKEKPYVIFEWHPQLIKQTGNNIHEAFKVLTAHDYNSFLFFSKYGTFTLLMNGYAEDQVEFYSKLCLSGKFDHDWHYDVIALPNNHQLDVLELAECSFAKNKRSPF